MRVYLISLNLTGNSLERFIQCVENDSVCPIVYRRDELYEPLQVEKFQGSVFDTENYSALQLIVNCYVSYKSEKFRDVLDDRLIKRNGMNSEID